MPPQISGNVVSEGFTPGANVGLDLLAAAPGVRYGVQEVYLSWAGLLASGAAGLPVRISVGFGCAPDGSAGRTIVHSVVDWPTNVVGGGRYPPPFIKPKGEAFMAAAFDVPLQAYCEAPTIGGISLNAQGDIRVRVVFVAIDATDEFVVQTPGGGPA